MERTRGRRVLIVEDERDLRETMALGLARAGSIVVEAADARDARERLRREVFDLVVTDLGLPGESGEAVIEAALATTPATPVLVVSGDPPDALSPAQHRRIAGFVRKPCSLGRLRHLVADLSRGRVAPQRPRSSRRTGLDGAEPARTAEGRR